MPRHRGVAEGRPLRPLLRLLQHPAGHVRGRARVPARHGPGVRRHHQARRQAPLRVRRGDGAQAHRHHPQGVRRRLLRHGEQAHPRGRELRVPDRRDRGDGARGRGQHPLPAGARRGRRTRSASGPSGSTSTARSSPIRTWRRRTATWTTSSSRARRAAGSSPPSRRSGPSGTRTRPGSTGTCPCDGAGRDRSPGPEPRRTPPGRPGSRTRSRAGSARRSGPRSSGRPSARAARRPGARPMPRLATPADLGGFDYVQRARVPRGVSLHPRDPADDVPGPPLDHAPVRRVRERGRDQPAVPLPPRGGADGAVGGVRPADPDGPRRGRPRGAERGRPGGRVHLERRRHGRAAPGTCPSTASRPR